MAKRSRSKSRGRRRGKDRAARSSSTADWAVLFYLAGDLKDDPERGIKSLAPSLQDDLKEILRAGASREVRIAVQHDHPETGAARYLLPNRPLRSLNPTVRLGNEDKDSGDAEVFADFLRWGLSECPAKRIALVLSGLSALDPGGDGGKHNQRVFTICRDDSAGGYLDVIELGTVIRQVLNEYGRDQFELLAIDSCQTQFLELAYELEGRVEVLLAPQNWVPDCGWDYTKVLRTWKQAARQPEQLDTLSLVRKLIPVITQSYRSGKKADRDRIGAPVGPYVVSALDLRRLDDVARAFDNLCIGVLQVLGEGLIWEARDLVFSLLNPDGNQLRPREAPRKQEQSMDATQAIDCGSLFAMLAASLQAMADESTQGWLGVTLQRGSGAAFDRFRTVAAESLAQCLRDEKDLPRLQEWIQALRSDSPVETGERMLMKIGNGIRDRVRLLPAEHSDSDFGDWSLASKRARDFDKSLDDSLRKALRLLPDERQVDYQRQREAAASARRLVQQATLSSRMLFGKKTSADVGKEDPADAEEGPGMVVATGSTDPDPKAWPHWSGVSLYRPPRLDALMNPSYQGFRFHQRIHWAAFLGAINLIESHPRALWRLVSSLLATGSAGTRRDLLQRLTGPDSVIWGLRDQFRVMAPAPTLTLSLEQRRLTRSTVATKKVRSNETEKRKHSKRENYLLRLESASRGAVITEQLSRVQPKVMDRALRELERLLEAPSTTVDSLKRLRAIGGLLGDDIFQTLGRVLEEERLRAQEEAAHLTPHLQLQIPRKLMGYPWELMHHSGEWLSEQFAIGRQVFMETGMARRVSQRNRGCVRPLIVGDPVLDPEVTALGWRQLPGARAEAEQVAGWFERLRQELGEMIDFDRQRDTRIHTRMANQEFRDLLRHGNYDIIHFAGHGVFNTEDPETSAWMLSDGELWALEIRNTLANHPAPPWMVYANACEAGMESRSMPQRTYQRNVFGLATAFLNQGVAAYVAPLWPIDDLLAQLIALDFYRQLLSERVTLGEALRRAKSEARRVAYPDSLEQSDDGAWASLGWASLVLYGDPTEELFQALAGSDSKSQSSTFLNLRTPVPPQDSPRANDPPIRHGRQCIHAPDRLLAEWVAGPQRASARVEHTSRGEAGDDPVILELIEEAGLRRWRIPSSGLATRGTGSAVPAHMDGLPGSPLAQLLADERLHTALPGRRGVVRVIWRWTKSGFSNGLNGLVEEYDKDQVPYERLVRILPNDLRPWTAEDWAALSPKTAQTPGALLLIHGTISKTASPVAGLGDKFLAWARQRYGIVLGFDHWTLSKTPRENATMLAEELQRTAPDLLANARLDIISHSRGGLVARAFCELLGHADAVRNLIFLATPNCGTDLANSKNWGRMADTLVNFSGMKHAEPIGYLAGLLARLAVIGGEQVAPGLLAQNPEMAGVPGEFLQLLQRPNLDAKGVRYSVITADFEPTPLVPNLKALWSTAKKMGIDDVADKFFQDGNDLIVNTSYVWCLDQSSAEKKKLPGFLDNRVLALLPPDSSVEIPDGVQRENALGVDHFNLFSNPVAQQCMKKWLSEA